ncbi:hypothetical protein BDV93DRAFT_521446 [Ceratobasidium sp. AG-I]|nr:hypothetical protein BDV93DRAFT_521446 [Ceratobasidium sp. AG-I]
MRAGGARAVETLQLSPTTYYNSPNAMVLLSCGGSNFVVIKSTQEIPYRLRGLLRA